MKQTETSDMKSTWLSTHNMADFCNRTLCHHPILSIIITRENKLDSGSVLILFCFSLVMITD